MKFIKYIYKDNDWLLKEYAKILRSAPPKKSLFKDEDLLKLSGMETLIEAMQNQKAAIELSPSLQTLMDNAMDRVTMQGMSPEESLDIANQELQRLLDDGELKYIY